MTWIKANQERNRRRQQNWDFSRERRIEIKKLKYKLLEDFSDDRFDL